MEEEVIDLTEDDKSLESIRPSPNLTVQTKRKLPVEKPAYWSLTKERRALTASIISKIFSGSSSKLTVYRSLIAEAPGEEARTVTTHYLQTANKAVDRQLVNEWLCYEGCLAIFLLNMAPRRLSLNEFKVEEYAFLSFFAPDTFTWEFLGQNIFDTSDEKIIYKKLIQLYKGTFSIPPVTRNIISLDEKNTADLQDCTRMLDAKNYSQPSTSRQDSFTVQVKTKHAPIHITIGSGESTSSAHSSQPNHGAKRRHYARCMPFKKRKVHDYSETVDNYLNDHTHTSGELISYRKIVDFVCEAVPSCDKMALAQEVAAAEGDVNIEALVLRELAAQAPDDFEDNQSVSSEVDIGSDAEDRINAHIERITEIFPDADPEFLGNKVTELLGDQRKVEDLVSQLTETRNYPKREEYEKRCRLMTERQKFIDGMSAEEFLNEIADPEKVFMDITPKMTPTYEKLAKHELSMRYPYHKIKDIEAVLKINNSHFIPSYRMLKDQMPLRKGKRSKSKQEVTGCDDFFVKELCYLNMEAKITEYRKSKEDSRANEFEIAKKEGLLQVCQCCYDEEVLLSEMSGCNDEEHRNYCNNCVKRYVEVQIGQGKIEFVCLDNHCERLYSMRTLERVLKPSVYSNLAARVQAKEVADAGIEDLESCPFCHFAAIMPNKEDKVFSCLNPDCMKQSCRLCREPNHIPLSCDEVEKSKQTETRTYMENEMTKAILRECYKCKKVFIKEDGCNKMVCSCGAMMCYLCKKPISGYQHFTDYLNNEGGQGPKKCSLWSNSTKLHAEELKTRAIELKESAETSVPLSYDPMKDVPELPEHLKVPKVMRDRAHAIRMRVNLMREQNLLNGLGPRIMEMGPYGMLNPMQRLPRAMDFHLPRWYPFYMGPPNSVDNVMRRHRRPH